ncbi:MAG: 7,8-didemethyl-8-hydroxy-5-deazariboflavin synthase subunit CofG, partial [Nitrosopumilus sp.]|nr:7,8-didemethyl-8-hydroxy-5-deazariboflavin synthase subunit CofG [Nitrosopumilus sp.]
MTNLVLKSEILNNVLENKSITRQEIIEVYENSKKNTNDLFLTAQNLRIKNKGNTVTFSKKAFFNIVNLCKDTCSYCTYKAEPGEEKISLMSK